MSRGHPPELGELWVPQGRTRSTKPSRRSAESSLPVAGNSYQVTPRWERANERWERERGAVVATSWLGCVPVGRLLFPYRSDPATRCTCDRTVPPSHHTPPSAPL